MAELKPCPFCGGKAILVPCDDEGNLHDIYDTPEEATEAWNRREERT
jgi:hypothetical protein